MKKLFFTAICATATLMTISCEKSADDVAVGGDKTATLSVNIGLPEISTRAFADGWSATQLQYAVYEVTDEGLKMIEGDEYCNKEAVIHLSTNLKFSLLKDHTYGLVFWAAAPSDGDFESPYVVDFGMNGATMKYSSDPPRSNSDKIDAFYAYKVVKVTGDSQITAQLQRPFAQINIGTNDFAKAKDLGVEPSRSSIKVEMNNTLNLVTGETSGERKEFTFEHGELPQKEKDGPFPVVGYDYLAMAYVLVGPDRATINVGFNYDGTDNYHMIGSVPVQRNYRTNIYGSLLTSNLDVNVDIEPGTGGDHDVMLTWDGETKTEPAYNEGSKTYTVSGADQLAWLASQENADYEGKTIVLESDLDLAGHAFPAFASGAQRSGAGLVDGSTTFKGVFDGKGKTIRGFKATDVSNKSEAAAFFSNISGDAEVKNVTFENVEIVSTTAEQAGIVGLVSGGATVENVKVMSGTISSVEAAGGIVGRILGKGEVKDCENHANVSTTEHNAGGIVGAAYYNNEGMSIADCDNYGTVSGKYAVGGIVGLNCGDVSGCNNYGTSVTGKAASVGGVVGEQKGSGKITACTNKADVSGGEGSTTNYGCGGIVGWVRYTTEDAYKNQSAIVVSGCTNEGKHIKGASGVGGIVGAWYSDGDCKENVNFAETITASGSFAAGIVGNSQWTEVDSQGGSKEAHTDGLKLTVHDNVSYTAKSDIQAGGNTTHLFVYINDSDRTVEEKNTNPSMTTVGSAEELTAALTTATDGAYIKMEKGEYEVFSNKNGLTAKNVTIDCGGAVFTGENHVRFDETTTIKNAHFKNYNTASRNGQGPAAAVYNDICGTYEDCIFEGVAALEYGSVRTNVTFKNCQFLASDDHAVHVDQFTVDGTVATFIGCTISGYCPLGGSHGSYVFEDCTFSTNEAGYGGVGLRRPTTMTDCKFYIGGANDHDEIALKAAGMDYVFNGCTVNGAPLTAGYDFTVGAEGIEVTIDQSKYTLDKTEDKPKRN